MNPQMSMYLAAAFELGTPIALGVLAAMRPSGRRWVVVVLGALTPLLLSLAATSVGHLVFAQEEATFIFREVWVTTLLPYAACLVFGAIAGLLRVPSGLSARYIMGLIPTAALALILAVTVPQ
jgi:hypothetical protein